YAEDQGLEKQQPVHSSLSHQRELMPDGERTELDKHLFRQWTFPVQKKQVVESRGGDNLRHYRIELCFRLKNTCWGDTS
ncbi:MAG TPA: hypothetical protein VGP12_05735, partial [Nitrosospira sp.]|nr:hypothetical protein [Nitrosospira sp.]